MKRRSTRTTVVDPHLYAERLVAILFEQDDRTQARRESAEAIISEAILASGGKVSVLRRCKNQKCDKLFRAGGWPLPGHQRWNCVYCSEKCGWAEKQRRHRARQRAKTKST